MSDPARELRRALRAADAPEYDVEAVLATVYTGVRRRRQRRAVLSTVVAVVLLAGGAWLAAPTDTVTGEPPTVANRRMTERGDQHPQQPSIAPPQQEPTKQDSQASGRPASFTAVSMTAISPSHWWVLGVQPCDAQNCLDLRATTTSGTTWTEFGTPQADDTVDTGGHTTTDTAGRVRFDSSAENGWAFGGGLWATHDGGLSWTRVKSLGDTEITLLEPSGNWVYAATDVGDLYRSPVSADAWRPVNTGVDIDGIFALSASASTVSVAARSGDTIILVTSHDQQTWRQEPTPCAAPNFARLSSSPESDWILCSTGALEQASMHVSTDRGAGWIGVPGQYEFGDQVAAVSDTQALVAGPSYGIAQISTSAPPATVMHLPANGAARQVHCSGEDVCQVLTGAGQLLQTRNGGESWQDIPVG